MKGFAIVLLCALAAVQGRYTDVQKSNNALAALGDNPYVVHLRIAVSTSGLLDSCVGSLIDSRWVLTSASCVVDVRFIWVRYGLVNVINPELVTENSVVRINPGYESTSRVNNIALISINRNVESTANIAPIALANAETEIGATATYCGFSVKDINEEGYGKPGEILKCFEFSVEVNEDGSLSVDSDEVETTAYDSGAPLVSNGVQIALQTTSASTSDGNIGTFTPVSKYLDWIKEETGLNFSPEAAPEAVPEVAPESVRVVNL